MTPSSVSLLSRLISRPRPAWLTVGVSVLLILAPFVALFLDGTSGSELGGVNWRPLLLSPAVIIYILVIGPIMARSDREVLHAFRPLVLLDDASFDRLVVENSRISRVAEWVSFVVGALLGLLVSRFWLEGGSGLWLGMYVTIALMSMYGLLGWVIYGGFAATKLTAALHRQPLRIDIFDAGSFAPIGRQSLVLALAFVGGITLSVIFGFQMQEIHNVRMWLIYIPLALVPVLLFFLNMRHTHRVLSTEKHRALEAAGRRIADLCRKMKETLGESETQVPLATELSALAAYETRVRLVPTWPYNTAMLRTLSISILIPLSVRAISFLIFGQ